MVINENNSYINSFTKGMNSDLAYDQLPNVNYTYAKNIRITKNLLIGDSKEDYSSVHEGIVSPVYKGFDISAEGNVEVQINGDILACDTVDTTGVIITRKENKLILYKFKIENDVIKAFDKWLVTKNYPEIGNLKAVSIVLYKELDNVIKAYIATGIWPMFTVRVDDDTEKYGEDVDIDSITNNRIMPSSPIYIEKQISGLLKTSQVQYTYRFYNKYGITTRLAPLTNKIQVIDSNRNKEIGNAEDTATTIGFSLKINSDLASGFNRMLIYRILYIKENEDANVYLIYDGNKLSTFNDVGVDALQELTMEEFSSLSGVQVIPKIIENNQDYMFASNVTDDTIIKGLKTKGGEIKHASTNICLAKGGSQMLPLTTGLNFRDGFGGNFISVKDDLSATIKVTDYLLDRNINPSLAKNTYNNIFTSSLLRSLRRGEKYKYGIVYYDKHGRRSDVIPIDSITIPDISNSIDDMSIINYQLSLSGYGTLMAKPVGVCITLPQPIKEDGSLVENIIGCQIVRRSSEDIYQKTLLLVALSRPMRLLLKQTSDPSESGIQSPYYPTGLLTSDHIKTNGYYNYDGESWFDAKTVDNKGLFQIFSSEIDFRREDTLNKVLQNDTYINPVQILYPVEEYNKLNSYERILALNASGRKQLNDAVKSGLDYIEDGSYDGSADHSLYVAKRVHNEYYGQKDKISDHLLYNYFLSASPQYTNKRNILTTADVKIPKWYEGFSNIQYNGAQIVGGIKQYKSYTTSLDEYSFNNWASSGLYDLQIWDQLLPNTWRLGDDYGAAQFLYDTDPPQRDHPLDSTDGDVYAWYTQCSKGFIGPGPSSLLVALEKSDTDMYTGGYPLGTYICNIEHNVEFQNSEPDEYVQYFGFGNYFKLVLDLSGTKYLINHNYDELNDKMYVFDGDIYITPHEITTLYKTYDFNSKDTLESMQITNYVPMESKVNTFFDYGMNYLNTQSTNLLYESGSITGVTSQNRPAHQYNMIYSNNDVSNDVFSLISTDEKETNTFPHRTYYSEPKVNGEFIDNFGIFKAASFIDVDSRQGEITELLTDKNTLYYWQTSGFGKFSVNERSLINDQNGNTIMLGLAGILSRFDYISTKYGMRPYDYCAIAAEGKIYWIDINNRAVVVGNTQDATNLGELLSVLNIINNNIDTDSIPDINYDILNNELLCRCLNDSELIVFNIKYNIPTSIYTRKYDKMIYIHNHMYGICIYNNVFTKYNYLPFGEIKDQQNKYLTPIELQFAVNPSASTTKVFDSQLIIPIKRSSYNPENVECRYFDNVYTEFETDIIDTNTNLIESHTDREGNIIYNIPRYGNTNYGNRMRGKWLKTYIKQEDLHEFFTISHVITKLRQSYS